MKDRFSSGSGNYLRFRPLYPDELIAFISAHVPEHSRAWDCGTGSGQLATAFSTYFHQVFATDISEQQLREAMPCANVHYSQGRAEQSEFADSFFDLIVAGQAIHWFDFNAFYREAKRTLKPGGIVALIGYGLIRTGENADKIIDSLYSTILGPYWDPERKYIDENYQTIPFPFEELPAPAFKMSHNWDLQQLTGYLDTWSAVKLYRQKEKQDPLALVMPQLKAFWGVHDKKPVYFDVLFRLGKNSTPLS